MKKKELDAKYKKILLELKKGKSLNQIAKEKGLDAQNMRRRLKKRYPKEYDRLVYGEIVGEYKGNTLRKIPQRQTNRTDTLLTKRAKEFLKKEFNCIEEVGIWFDNYRKRFAIDLYSVDKQLGIELCWQASRSFKQLKQKLETYQKLFGNIICALLKDSSFRKTDRSYIYIQKKLLDEGFRVIIVDVGKTHPITERPIFQMEKEKKRVYMYEKENKGYKP